MGEVSISNVLCLPQGVAVLSRVRFSLPNLQAETSDTDTSLPFEQFPKMDMDDPSTFLQNNKYSKRRRRAKKLSLEKAIPIRRPLLFTPFLSLFSLFCLFHSLRSTCYTIILIHSLLFLNFKSRLGHKSLFLPLLSLATHPLLIFQQEYPLLLTLNFRFHSF